MTAAPGRGQPKNSRLAFLAATFAAFALASPVAAQDSFSINEDEVVAKSAAGSAVGSLLQTDTVRIGGSFSGSTTATWQWNDPWADGLDPASPDSHVLKPALSALVFFDARPTEASRFYGSVKTAWPFTEAGDTQVFELFSDFSHDDAIYFRFGKQTINWGVGYFFSPANIMNLDQIDPTDPTAQLEGPVAIRAMVPVKGTQHNLWAYAVFDQATMKPEDTALAAKAEFVSGGWELGAGAYFKRGDPLRGMLTAVGSMGQASLFGEATLSRGSSKKWVSEVGDLTPTGIIPRTDDTSLFFKGTTGFRYTNGDANVTVMGQYLYDGEGYANADREALIDKVLLQLGPAADDPYPMLFKKLILGSGRHYAALTFVKNEFLAKDLSFSAFGIANLSDFSGYLKPTLSYSFFDGLSMSVSAMVALGFDSGEYVVLNDGRALALSVALTLGSGAF
jgi:hypothetical protein